ncbi:hypothetical protein [Asticcacaulis sp. 201]|uniref:hypothetical protein n=1 Tax=Asticcacaulis sp. 201 TaxID=3028787 RepID=UPI0029165E0B|nr:hypothetical protein [Asticcacaulis sp. 201]MDV6331151.1 hypothetical protein [Asticcacaulis sp. 201]
MRTAALPDALLAAAIGLALSYAHPKVARQSAMTMIVTALTTAFVPMTGMSDDLAFNGCWASIIIAAAAVHVPVGWLSEMQMSWLWRVLAFNAGLWAGLVTHVEGGAPAVIVGLPLALLFIPGQIFVKRNWGIAIKVACSWLIAIAVLEVGLNLVPTPGYTPDHMD